MFQQEDSRWTFFSKVFFFSNILKHRKLKKHVRFKNWRLFLTQSLPTKLSSCYDQGFFAYNVSVIHIAMKLSFAGIMRPILYVNCPRGGWYNCVFTNKHAHQPEWGSSWGLSYFSNQAKEKWKAVHASMIACVELWRLQKQKQDSSENVLKIFHCTLVEPNTCLMLPDFHKQQTICSHIQNKRCYLTYILPEPLICLNFWIKASRMGIHNNIWLDLRVPSFHMLETVNLSWFFFFFLSLSLFFFQILIFLTMILFLSRFRFENPYELFWNNDLYKQYSKFQFF